MTKQEALDFASKRLSDPDALKDNVEPITDPVKIAQLKIWINALRAGHYQQTRSYLYSNEGGYCCLGVACELLGVARDALLAVSMPRSLPKPPELPVNVEVQHALAALNDDGVTFAEIADVLEGLFLNKEFKVAWSASDSGNITISAPSEADARERARVALQQSHHSVHIHNAYEATLDDTEEAEDDEVAF